MQLTSTLPWKSLVTELTAKGFRQVLHFELSCASHGDFRAAWSADSEMRPESPRCGEAGSISILARGLTRGEIVWRLVSPALPASAKAEEFYEGTFNRYAGRGTTHKSHSERKQSARWFSRIKKELAGIR